MKRDARRIDVTRDIIESGILAISQSSSLRLVCRAWHSFWQRKCHV